MRIGDRYVELGPGETAEVPAGAPHTWTAVGEEPLRMTITLAPALTAEGFFEDLFGMAEAGRVDANGLPSLLGILTILYEHPDVVYLVKPPVAVQKAAARVGGPIGRALGVLRAARELRAARVVAAA